MAEKSNLKILKENYSKIQEKYALPNFVELNEDFQIEKVADVETELLIKEIRKAVSEKFSSLLRFIESILNPVEASSIFMFSIINTISSEEKKRLNEIYKKLADNEIKILELEINFSEEKEAEFVKESYELWQEIKKDMQGVIETIKKNWNNKFEPGKNGYFG